MCITGRAKFPSPCPLLYLFSYRFGLGKQQQIVRATSLAIRAAHIEPAEWMHANQRPCTLAIEVQIAYVIHPPRHFKTAAIPAVDCSRQAKLGAVGNINRILEIARPDHRQHWPEDFFLSDT